MDDASLSEPRVTQLIADWQNGNTDAVRDPASLWLADVLAVAVFNVPTIDSVMDAS